MTPVRSLVALGLFLSSAASAQTCESYLGQKVELSDFDAVVAALPRIAPRDRYESTSDYARRLALAPDVSISPFIVPVVPDYPGRGLSYDPDRKLLKIYATAFGAGQVNFGDVFRDGYRSGYDNFSGAVGFRLSARTVDETTYEANNAFGAKVTVTRTTRDVQAVWERAGKRMEDPLVGMKSGVVASLTMEPDAARELIERGRAALMFVPRAPFRAQGQSTIPADFRRPRERIDRIDVVVADIQCAFLVDPSGNLTRAFIVK